MRLSNLLLACTLSVACGSRVYGRRSCVSDCPMLESSALGRSEALAMLLLTNRPVRTRLNRGSHTVKLVAGRRAILSGGGALVANAFVRPAYAKKKKDYMTNAEKQEKEKKEKRNAQVTTYYGTISDGLNILTTFEELAQQLLGAKESEEVDKAALVAIFDTVKQWNVVVQEGAIAKATNFLSGDDKAAAAKISKSIDQDLKDILGLERRTMAEMPEITARVRGKAIDILKLLEGEFPFLESSLTNADV